MIKILNAPRVKININLYLSRVERCMPTLVKGVDNGGAPPQISDKDAKHCMLIVRQML